jgi:UDP-glucose 4-epimerase
MQAEPKVELRDVPVLVTGGAGFIGSELSRQLCAHGALVQVVDNLANGKRENLAGLPPDRVCLHVVDIRAQDCLQELLVGIKIVFHLACLGVRHSIHSPYENHEVNAEATLRLLESARKAGVERFVYVSSSEVYGTGSGRMSENYPAFPNTVYGASKLAGECYARAYYRTYGYPTVMVRPFNAYGPRCHHEGDSGEVIPKFMLRCLAGKPMIIFGDGTQVRDFTYVSDVARGILLAGVVDECIGKTINLGSNQPVTINELAQEVAKVAGVTNPQIQYEASRPGDVLYLSPDTTLAQQLLGFKPRVPLRRGLELLRDWYLSLGVSPERLLEAEVAFNWEKPC